MKILILHQPHPSGNYLLQARMAEILNEKGYDEVYLIEQLHGRPNQTEYEQAIIDLDPDVVYFEMLDKETFEIIEKLKNSKKILCYASKGLLQDYYDIEEYHGKWYDYILTNALPLHKHLKAVSIPSEHWEYYFSALDDNKIEICKDYRHDSVFLGLGHHRLISPHYELERSLFLQNMQLFNEHNVKVYGVGWNSQSHYYGGTLPPDDIGRLYKSSKSAFAMIEHVQRGFGAINNRYVEIGWCETPIITYNYPEIDWFGADKYLYFTDGGQKTIDIVQNLKNIPIDSIRKAEEFKEFLTNKHNEFVEKLIHFIEK